MKCPTACFFPQKLIHSSSTVTLQGFGKVVTKWIKSYLLQCFGTFKMPILIFISVLVFRPEGQI